jgi:catechol 2,3-dioxygenase-like lactoylglutathione lyase family enzyme
MILGGNATVYVSDFERAVRFYTEALGLALRFRAENRWAEVAAGDRFVIGIHPVTPTTPKAGVAGSVQIGLDVEAPLERTMERLAARGVRFDGPIVGDPKAGLRFAFLRDPDGNPIYLWESGGAGAE